MLEIILSIAPIFLLIAIGYGVKNHTSIDDLFWSGCTKIAYYLFFPALLINALLTVNLSIDLHKVIIPLSIVTVMYAAVLLLFQSLIKSSPKQFTSIFQGIVRYNSYIFIGVSVAIYGHASLAIVAIIMAYMIVLTNVLSITILSMYASEHKTTFSKIIIRLLKNPILMSCVCATIWNEFDLPYPELTRSLLIHLGGAALPISLMCVGAGLRFQSIFKHITRVLLVDVIKLIAFPVSVAIALHYFHCTGMAKNIAIIYAVVPTAGNAYILAKQMDGDHELMATLICSMVLLSFITIPIMLTLLS